MRSRVFRAQTGAHMNKLFLVATTLISLQLSAMTLTCIETQNGYPTSRLMLKGTPTAGSGYTLAHQTMGKSFFDTTETMLADNVSCQFAPKDNKLLSCQGGTATGMVDVMTRRIEETTLNNFFGMMTTVKNSFLEFTVTTHENHADADRSTSKTMRFALASCKVKKDSAQEEPAENSDV